MRFFLAMFTSSFRNFSYCSLMYFSMGSQLEEGGREQVEAQKDTTGSPSHQGQEAGSHLHLTPCLPRALGDLLTILSQPPWVAFPVSKGRTPLWSESSDWPTGTCRAPPYS